MKALSIIQPWATLIVIGAKRFETRGWDVKYRGPLLIHASAKQPSGFQAHKFTRDPFFKDFIKNMYDLPYGAVIGKVDLINTYPTLELLNPQMFNNEIELTDQEKAFGDYTPGRFAWEMANASEIKPPVPYKGSLNIWEFPDNLLPVIK